MFKPWPPLLFLFALLATGACAENLGKIGPTYPIAERNFLDLIMERLRAKEDSGELAKAEQLARTRATEAITNPVPAAGLHRADAAKTYYFDPTFTFDRNVVDDKGALLFPIGTKQNPLSIVTLSKHLLFFDGRDQRQVARARELIDTYNGKVKPILVGGSYLELMRAWNLPVYYDQHGVLVKRLGITGVPAIVSQEGLRLRIDELVLR